MLEYFSRGVFLGSLLTSDQMLLSRNQNMGKKRKILLIALPIVILAILTGWFLFGQTPQAVPEPTPLPPPAPSTPSTQPTSSTPSATSTPSTTSTQSPETPETPHSTADTENPEELPQNLLVVPEVPLGSLAIVLACFSALLIAQRKSKSPLPLKI
jgi:cytoskeletal protein RodZ